MVARRHQERLTAPGHPLATRLAAQRERLAKVRDRSRSQAELGARTLQRPQPALDPGTQLTHRRGGLALAGAAGSTTSTPVPASTVTLTRRARGERRIE